MDMVFLKLHANLNICLFWACTIYTRLSQWGYINCLVTDILLNIIFCAQQKKEIHTGLDQSK